MKKGKNIVYINNSIYILQYPGGKNLGVSYGILKGIYEDKKYNFNHVCSTEEGSSGSPIINLINNKVIGIHKESDIKNNYNMGLFLNYAIKDFINNNYIIKEFNIKTMFKTNNIKKEIHDKYKLNTESNINKLDNEEKFQPKKAIKRKDKNYLNSENKEKSDFQNTTFIKINLAEKENTQKKRHNGSIFEKKEIKLEKDPALNIKGIKSPLERGNENKDFKRIKINFLYPKETSKSKNEKSKNSNKQNELKIISDFTN